MFFLYFREKVEKVCFRPTFFGTVLSQVSPHTLLNIFKLSSPCPVSKIEGGGVAGMPLTHQEAGREPPGIYIHRLNEGRWRLMHGDRGRAIMTERSRPGRAGGGRCLQGMCGVCNWSREKSFVLSCTAAFMGAQLASGAVGLGHVPRACERVCVRTQARTLRAESRRLQHVKHQQIRQKTTQGCL